jgi:hypothetical protein
VAQLRIWCPSVKEMMDCIEPDQPLNDQVHRDDDIQQPRNDQDENAGNESDDG